MSALLVLMSAAAVLAGNVPMICDTWRRTARPVAMSWGGWAAIMVIAAGGSAEARQVPSMVYTGACAAGCAAVALLALRIPVALRDDPASAVLPRGIRVRLDLLCLPAAAAGLVLLAAARDPGLAVAVSIATDAVLYVPTAAHAWRYPDHEPWAAYGLFGLGACLALAAAAIGGRAGSLAAAGYPWYLAVTDTGVAAMILARRRVIAAAAAVLPGSGPPAAGCLAAADHGCPAGACSCDGRTATGADQLSQAVTAGVAVLVAAAQPGPHPARRPRPSRRRHARPRA
jgi:hypothetical protein